ncbi:MAG: hypothetical protein LQ339_004121 [Xanthoria mediterranea]|nr:MAG: hypothetical protein LQ339_004121 [Xanthoria mediterranea]
MAESADTQTTYNPHGISSFDFGFFVVFTTSPITAKMNQEHYEIYRQSSIGTTLIDSLDDLINSGRIEPQLANKIVKNFDKIVSEVMNEKVKARLNFKGHLDTYRFCDEVWTFLIKDVNFKLDNQNPIQAEKIKIVSCNSKRPGET